MKHWIVFVGIATQVMCMGNIVAQRNQGGRPPRMTVEQQVNQMKTELKLTDEQKDKNVRAAKRWQKSAKR